MIKKLLMLAVIATVTLASCKKEAVDTPIEPIKTIGNIAVPAGFKWENSRNLNLSVGTSDTKFPGKLYVVAIYASDPVSGGKLLAKGSLSTSAKFKSKFYLSNQITELYFILMAPDGAMSTKKIQAGGTDLEIDMSL